MSDKSIREIKDGDRTLAIVWSNTLSTDGVKFLTPSEYTLQVGLLEHHSDHSIPAHRHPNITYNVATTQEFLYIERGKVEATLYLEDWTIKEKLILETGDFILLVSGGHGFTVLDDARIIEIKQGPYPGDAKAKIFMGPDGKDSATRPK